MNNPNKAIRTAYVQALDNVISVPVWDRRVPKDIDEPETYVLITSQTATDSHRTKCGNNTNDCTILLQTIHKNDQGYADSAIVDDIHSEIIPLINNNGWLQLVGFKIMDTEMELNNVDDAFEFDTQTVIRGLLRFRHQVRESS